MSIEAMKQEPVAWVELLKEAEAIVRGKLLWKRFIDGTPLENDIPCWMANFAQQYTAPQRREWVGLTTPEIFEIRKAKEMNPLDFARAIEARLKEKNQ